MIASRRIRRRAGGQMLIVVLWVMGLLSLAVGALTMQSTHELQLGHVPLQSVQRDAIAQAGVQQAIRIVVQDTQDAPQLDTLQEPWATGEDANHVNRFTQIAVGDGLFSVGHLDGETLVAGLVDEERKMNLNVATVDQIRHLIQSVQPGGIDAQALANAIVDWRDEPVGPACQGLTPPCHNGPFDSFDELRLVPGMTPELVTALAPYVTVYGSGSVNVNTAPALVLDAMGAPGETLVAQRATQPFTSYPGFSVTSTVFTALVDAQLATTSGRSRVRAVIDRAGCGPTPPAGKRCLLAWSME